MPALDNSSCQGATVDEHQKHPMTDDPLASNINPTSIVCFAYIFLSLAIQPRSNVDTAEGGAFTQVLWTFDMISSVSCLTSVDG